MAAANTSEKLLANIRGYSAGDKGQWNIDKNLSAFIKRGITMAALPANYDDNGYRGANYQELNFPGATDQNIHRALNTVRTAKKMAGDLADAGRGGYRRRRSRKHRTRRQRKTKRSHK